jgi:hypothetical protein
MNVVQRAQQHAHPAENVDAGRPPPCEPRRRTRGAGALSVELQRLCLDP